MYRWTIRFWNKKRRCRTDHNGDAWGRVIRGGYRRDGFWLKCVILRFGLLLQWGRFREGDKGGRIEKETEKGRIETGRENKRSKHERSSGRLCANEKVLPDWNGDRDETCRSCLFILSDRWAKGKLFWRVRSINSQLAVNSWLEEKLKQSSWNVSIFKELDLDLNLNKSWSVHERSDLLSWS